MSTGTVVQADLGGVELGGFEPAPDSGKALLAPINGSGAPVEVDDHLVALTSQRYDLSTKVLEALKERERQRG